MKNKLSDLNDHLFAQLERLNDEEIEGEALESEIERSKAVTSVAKEIVSNAKTVLEGEKMKHEYGTRGPKMLEDGSDENR